MDVLSQLRLKNIKEHIKNDPYLKDNALYYLPQGNQEIKVKLIALIKDDIHDIKEFILKYRLYRKYKSRNIYSRMPLILMYSKNNK